MGKQELKVSGNNSSALKTGKTKQSDLFRTPMPTDYLSRKFVKSNSSVIKQNTILNYKKYSLLPGNIKTVLLYSRNIKLNAYVFPARGFVYDNELKLKFSDPIYASLILKVLIGVLERQ